MRGARLDRWRRVALASVKQSRRAVLPEVRTPLTFDTWLDEPLPPVRLIFVEPTGHGSIEPLSALRNEPVPPAAVLAVGPEGGWDPAESARAGGRGLRLVSLGRRTLRADAVAIAAMSVLEFLWDQS